MRVRQAADVVVRLDHLRAVAGRAALDHVRVERALGEELDRPSFFASSSNTRDELVADDLALPLGVRRRRRAARGSARARPPRISVDAELRRQFARTPPRASPCAQQPVVHEHAGQPVADRAVDAARRPRVESTPPDSPHRTCAARRPARAMSRDRLAHEVLHAPAALQPATRKRKLAAPAAVGGVHDLGVELDEVERPLRRGARRRRRSSRCAPRATKPGGSACDLVAVAHPGAEAPRHAARTAARRRSTMNVAMPYSARVGLATAAAEQLRGDLEAVADAEQRLAQRVDRADRAAAPRRGSRSPGEPERMSALRACAPRSPRPACVPGTISREDAQLAHAAGDELRVLRAEVEDEDQSRWAARARSGRRAVGAGQGRRPAALNAGTSRAR